LIDVDDLELEAILEPRLAERAYARMARVDLGVMPVTNRRRT
jgi:hypothetical protein